MFSLINIILVISILLQMSAAICALSLIRLTGKMYSWILISIALMLMCFRRLIPLYYSFFNMRHLNDLPNEIIGMILSLLMFLGVLGIRSIFIERRHSEEKIKTLLAEKEIILKEVHHRIKNNMNTIKSLFALQAETLDDVSAIAALNDAGRRVSSMSVIYEKLYQSDDFQNADVINFLPSLVDDVISNFPNSNEVKVEKDISNFRIDIKKLQIVGIIVNELISNMMKAAFIGRKDGVISVSVTLKGTLVTVVIKNNGNHMPESVDFKHTAGFGLKLVDALASQLNGTIRLERNHETAFYLEFEL